MTKRKGYPSRSLAERIWAKTDRTSTACWLWTAHIDPSGYGRLKFGGQVGYAHTLAYELLVGPVPHGLELDHRCRVRHCCNPAHLEPVTHTENIRRGMRGQLKTHCPAGHPRNPENQVSNGSKYTRCRLCLRDRKRATRDR